MKRLCYLLVALSISLTMLCCENPNGGAEDIPATTDLPTTPDTPTTPDATETPEIPAAPTTPVDDSKAALSSLGISAGILNPAFSPDTLVYTASVDTSFASVTLTGKAAYEKATLDANNGKPQNLADGKNVLSYKVSSEDGGVSRVYTVTITREKDSTPPVIVSSTMSVDRVNTSKASATVTGTIVAEDPSGMGDVANFMFYVLNGSGPTAKVTKDTAKSTFTRGVYNWTVSIPQFSELGSYDLKESSLILADRLNNQTTNRRIEFPNDEQSEFQVYKSDFSAPVCTTTSQSTNLIYVTTTITGSVTLEDPSGDIYANHFVFKSSEGNRSPTVTKNTKLSTATKAVYDWSVTIYKGSTTTTYYLNFDAEDRYGNKGTYSECSITFDY